MSEIGSGQSARSARIHAWVAALLAAAIGLPILYYPLGIDQSVFQYVADRWMHGYLPYRDAWDIKPVGTYLLYALPQFLVGTQDYGPRLLDIVCVFFIALGLNRIVCQTTGARYHYFAGIYYAIAYFACFNFTNLSQSESLAMPFCVWAYVEAYRRESSFTRRFAIIGVCLAASILIKPTMTILILPAFFIGWPKKENYVKAIGGTLVGLIVVLAPIYAYLYANGLGPYLAELNAVQVDYAKTMELPSWTRVRLQCNWFSFYPLHFIGALISLAIALFTRFGKLCAILTFLGLVSVALQGKYLIYHFVVMTMPAALAAGFAWEIIRERLNANSNLSIFRLPLYSVPILLLVINIKYFVVPLTFATGLMSREKYLTFHSEGIYSSLPAQTLANQIITRSHQTNTSLYCYTFDPVIYLYTGMRTQCRFFSNQFLSQGWYPNWFRFRVFREISTYLETSPPDFIVIQNTVPPDFRFATDGQTISVGGATYNIIYKSGSMFLGELDR
ncbi:MAG TPA: glycosyltransferase family 39 protein [Fimbriimonadaceae bacterium]|nr:glycosyltransferase family 39 protein [Fimbriimonadaceae bacterium]